MQEAVQVAYKFVTQLQALNKEMRDDNIEVSVVTVNWNVKELIVRLIESLFKYTHNIRFEIIAVDNQSHDGSVEFIKRKFCNELNQGRLVLIPNDFNAGFAKANNQGLKIARGKYILFMNPDMEVHDNVILKLRNFYETKGDIGIATCRLLYADKSIQPNVKRLPDFCSQLLILLKLHHFLKWLPCIKRYLMKDFDYLSEREVEQAMGACIFTKKELMDKIGGWNEEYWLWWEDVELCQNFLAAKHKIYFTPLIEITHFEGKSFAQTFGLKKQKRFNRGMLLYFKKHQPYYQYLILYCLQPLSWLLTLIAQLLKVKARPQSQI